MLLKMVSPLPAFLAAVFWSVSAGAEVVRFPSYSPDSYRAIIDGSYRRQPADIAGDLTLPAGAGPHPVVVIMHGSVDAPGWIAGVVAPLTAAGFATFVVDSFGPRGFGGSATNQPFVPVPATVVDAFAALSVLSHRPGLDARRIAVVGFSRGGVAAMFAAEERLARVVLADGPRYAAHVAFHPPCSAVWRSPMPTSAPILFFLGEADDFAPAEQCVAYSTKLLEHGGSARYRIFPGAHHAWMTDHPPRLNRGLQVFAGCSMVIENDGTIVLPDLAMDDRSHRAFAAVAYRVCGRRGATLGADPNAARQAIAELLSFLAEPH